MIQKYYSMLTSASVYITKLKLEPHILTIIFDDNYVDQQSVLCSKEVINYNSCVMQGFSDCYYQIGNQTLRNCFKTR